MCTAASTPALTVSTQKRAKVVFPFLSQATSDDGVKVQQQICKHAVKKQNAMSERLRRQTHSFVFNQPWLHVLLLWVDRHNNTRWARKHITTRATQSRLIPWHVFNHWVTMTPSDEAPQQCHPGTTQEVPRLKPATFRLVTHQKQHTQIRLMRGN